LFIEDKNLSFDIKWETVKVSITALEVILNEIKEKSPIITEKTV
jgi:hypothetical protein